MFCALLWFDRSEGISAVGECKSINGVVNLRRKLLTLTPCHKPNSTAEVGKFKFIPPAFY
jgi:hypothetical protein